MGSDLLVFCWWTEFDTVFSLQANRELLGPGVVGLVCTSTSTDIVLDHYLSQVESWTNQCGILHTAYILSCCDPWFCPATEHQALIGINKSTLMRVCLFVYSRIRLVCPGSVSGSLQL